jgi:hypothetical protein
MGMARNLASLLNGSGLVSLTSKVTGSLPNDNIAAMAASKLTGQVPDANAPSGSVIQVEQAYRQDTQSFSNYGFTTFATAIDKSITPRSSSNSILISAYIAMGANELTDNATPGFRLTRNGTAIAVGFGTGSRIPATAAHQTGTQTNLQGMATYAVTFLDSPATTSSVTYAIEVQNRNTGYTLYVGRNGSDNDTQENKRLPTILVLQEIQA